MTIEKILLNFTELYESICEAESADGVRNVWFDDPDLSEAAGGAQAILDKGLTCASCKYDQDDLMGGRPCACLTCVLSHLTPEQQKNKINYEAR